MWLKVLRFSFIILLTVLFIYFQAIPLISKFLSRDIVTVSSISTNSPQDAPALTFCVKDSYKDLPLAAVDGSFIDICNSSTVEEVNECYKKYTYKNTDFIKAVNVGFIKNTPFLNDQYWTSHFQTVRLGRCHTVQIPVQLGANMVRDAVFALLDAETDLTYTMYIHDPNYLLMAGNPLVFSRIYIVHSKLKSSGRNGSAEYFYLTAHKHEKLEFDPLGRKKCTLTPNYNYMACIEEYGARTIGCHPSWDSNFGDYPNCTTLEQLRKHNDLYQIYYNEDKNTIESLTGCLEPCNYFEYKIVGDKQSFIFPDPTSFMIGFNFVSTSYQILKEEPLYPLDSFVGEFGGAFGLFLGASFLSFWDLLEYLVTKISKLGKLK